MPLTLSQCILRPWCASDRESLAAHANDRRVWRNLTDLFPHPYTLADADRWIASVADIRPPQHFAIEVAGQAVGGIGFTVQHGIFCKTAELDYWLGHAHWGKGIATEAVGAVMRHAFATHALARLEAGVFTWNPASMRVLEKSGFSREGTLRRSAFKDGQLTDRVMYAFTRELPTRG